MPTFYFDVSDPARLQRDEVGTSCVDLEEARVHCQALLHHIALEIPPTGDTHAIICDLRDDLGRVVYRGELTYRGTILTG